MSFLEAILLGILQGLTEFLPVSSSGHLVLAQALIGLQEPLILFDVLLHVGSLTAVIIFFRRQILNLSWRDWAYLGVGTVPAIIVGLIFESSLERMFTSPKLIGITLLITACVNFWSDSQMDKKNQPAEKKDFPSHQSKFLGLDFIQMRRVATVGLFQAFALFPGVSRSGTTLAGSLKLGFSREKAFELTFLLAIPAIIGAAGWQVFKLINQGVGLNQLATPTFLLGAGASFIVSLASLTLLSFVIKRARFEVFGWYCALAGAAALLYFR
ncbi:MAG: Undecaprenyl-diphosphatase [Parcubacteria group bacterium GW2011_GWF2_44_8]|nr:MAG: Undecaprenyl-diphosphatase [Parcubacteria group bacterium GW2011_GWF2_44_8]